MDLVAIILLSFFFLSTIRSQQQYSANSAIRCDNDDSSGPSSAFLYTCNGAHPCKAFLVFKSEKPYDSVPAISQLLSSDPDELAEINSASPSTVFPAFQEVIVPVTCSCVGRYYQANTTFTITSDAFKTYSVIANSTFQGLTTCSSLMRANVDHGEFDLVRGMKLRVPLRCACPTKNQTASGAKYLLTYLVFWGDKIPNISRRFNATTGSVMSANNLTPNTTIFPFTTLLIPMSAKPSSSQTIIQYPNQSTPVPPKPTSALQNEKTKTKASRWIGIGAGCVVLVLGVVFSAIFMFRNRRNELLRRIDSKRVRNWKMSKDLRVEIASFEQSLRVYTFSELKKATGSFSSKNKIKGSVYYGKLDGEMLAVKRTSVDVAKEVNILQSINHFNLIKLQGVCENRGSYYLVFEYMQNGSLREWVGKEGEGSCGKRIEIVLDVANGLHYLHSFTKPAYVHKDINTTNILLDANLRAKVANFRLARSAEREARGDFQTAVLVGSRGYVAPEYAESGQVSPMIDVYAFGVVMLELITGKREVLRLDGDKEVLLAGEIVRIMRKDDAKADLASFLDPTFRGSQELEFALRVAKLSVACLTKDPTSRPSMAELVSALSKICADMHKSGHL